MWQPKTSTVRYPCVCITCLETHWFKKCDWFNISSATPGLKGYGFTVSFLFLFSILLSAATCGIRVHSIVIVARKVITEHHFLWLWKPIFWASGPHQRTDWVLKRGIPQAYVCSPCTQDNGPEAAAQTPLSKIRRPNPNPCLRLETFRMLLKRAGVPKESEQGGSTYGDQGIIVAVRIILLKPWINI